MIEPDFLSVDDVLLIQDEQIQTYGGIHGIRYEGLLESAVMTPQASFGGEYLHQGLFEMAAAYGFHIAEISPFSTAISERLFRLRWFFSTLMAMKYWTNP